MSKDEAIEVLSDIRAENNLFGDEIEATRYHALSWAISAMKSTNGKWVWMGDTGDSRWMCSVCKCKENVPTMMGRPIVWRFCPNCGAEMEG